MPKTALLIGAGPAGLTAALEFLRRSEVYPIVLEASHEIGGISRTVRHNGNRIDIGGHRFFSKSDRVMNWWMDLMPPEATADAEHALRHQNKQRTLKTTGPGASPETTDLVMLVRPRKSRIYFLRRFFDYPIKLTGDTLGKLGMVRTLKIGVSYLMARLFPRKVEKSLEDFLVNRFGRQLYLTFFKSYTEKVWGVPCESISAEWGAQRIKGLSLTTAVLHFLKKAFASKKDEAIQQKGTETSLIEKFLYPKYGPGQLWEYAADQIRKQGGEILLGWRAARLFVEADTITAVEAVSDTGLRRTFSADYVFSTMPVRELIDAMDTPIPEQVREVSDGLQYRDFITVGLLVDHLTVREADGGPLRDNWIYIQEPDVLVGRLQIFNNWSPYMVADPSKTWIGLEYFCYQTDALWKMADEDLKNFAIAEVEKIGILRARDVTDAHVVRVPKTYPAYFGTYDRFHIIREFLDRFHNLYLVGRNGMHKYNNQDHSMLTAMTAVDNIIAGVRDKDNVWSINTEMEYHEEEAKDEAKDESRTSSSRTKNTDSVGAAV
ncbi:MAG TPA: NAD(P)/FAD-dependent oxidoreductase [Acidobacteriaceae bacterium]|nr:NAD(P)/FAD-dependent oxidoreductase [Acidobacteriaceae bacterium]